MATGDEAFEAWRQRAADADILDIAISGKVGAKLRRTSREWIGPCPRCGGKDRFSVRPSKQVFNCRGAGGGDVIAMVMHACAVDFLAACEIITGEPPPGAGSVLTDEARRKSEEAKARAREQQRRREHDENLYRQRERKTVFDIWDNAHPLDGSSGADYLALRGLSFPPTPAGRAERLKCVEDMPYHLDRDTIEHRGPALIAPIVDAERKFRGLHFTYLDLKQPKGKLALQDPRKPPGELLDAKKSRGSKQGNAIALLGPADDPAQLILGEGNEKLIAVHMALAAAGRPLERTAFWSAADLGNLGGKAADSVVHPTLKNAKTGRAQKVAGATPDLDAPAIAIPDSVADLVLLGDTTSDPLTTQLALARASARYARPGRSVRVAWPPLGQDFDDLLRAAKGDAAATADALAAIAAAIDAAGPIAAPEIPVSEAPAPKSARRQPRSARSSSLIPTDKSSQPSRVDSIAPPGAAAASPLAAVGNNSDREQPSQMGQFDGIGMPDGAGAGDGEGDGDDLNRRCARKALTDLGNVERFVERNRGKFMWCQVLGWLVWDGKRWSRDGAGSLVEAAVHRTHRLIQEEAAIIAAGDDDFEVVAATRAKPALMWSDAIGQWGRKSENSGKLNCIARDNKENPGLAAPYLLVSVHELDADPMRINVLNGTLTISREHGDRDCITFGSHRPGDLITKICPVDYDPNATCVLYDRFLPEVQPDERMRRFLHQWGGLSLTGDVGEHKMCFWWGKGRNGKSTLLETWAHVAGGYAGNTQIETFLDHGKSQSGGQATPQLAKLPGVRMLRTSEPDKGAKLAEALIKAVTGGDTIDARHLNREFFSFVPQFKLTMFGNYQPKITGTDDGIWARLALVPWVVMIPKERRDQGLLKKLCKEASGILNRLLDGLRDWVDHGLIEPEAVTAATQKYREDSDPLGRFLGVCVRAAPGKRVQSSEMHKLFNAWAKASGATGAREWTATGLGRALAERGYVSKQSNVMWWLDIELLKKIGDFIDHEGKPLHLGETEDRGDDDTFE